VPPLVLSISYQVKFCGTNKNCLIYKDIDRDKKTTVRDKKKRLKDVRAKGSKGQWTKESKELNDQNNLCYKVYNVITKNIYNKKIPGRNF
jgi:hypothetical protein